MSEQAARRSDDGSDGSKNDHEDDAREHLDGLENGAGCTEIWERLSQHRNERC